MSDFMAGMVEASEDMLKLEVVRFVVVRAANCEGACATLATFGAVPEYCACWSCGWAWSGGGGVGSLLTSPPGSAWKSGGSLYF